jgi:hypothetical protein
MSTIELMSGPCGSGKTTHKIKEILEQPGLYLIAVDRRESALERLSDIETMRASSQAPPTVQVEAIYGYDKDRFPEGAVDVCETIRRRMSYFRDIPRPQHVVLVVTHDAWKRGGLSGAGWQLIIDEAPAIIATGSLPCRYQLAGLEANFRLDPIDGDALSILIARDALLGTDVAINREAIGKVGYVGLLELYDSMFDGTTLIDVESWDELARRDTINWLSMISDRALNSFDKVCVLSSRFRLTLTHQVLSNIFKVVFQESSNAPPDRESRKRRITIEYYTDQTVSLTRLSRSTDFLTTLVAHVKQSAPKEHIYAFNSKFENAFELPGQRLTPRAAGSNKWLSVSQASIFVAMNASPDELIILERFGVSKEDVKVDREYETIVQFVTRTSIRVANSAADCHFRMFSKDQAEYVEKYFADLGHTVVLEKIELGVDLMKAVRGGRKSIEAAPLSAAERQRRRRERDKARRRVVQ